MTQARDHQLSRQANVLRRDGLLQVSVSLLGVMGILYALGCSPQVAPEPDPSNDYSQTVRDVGSAAPGCSHTIEYYKAAEPAQKQIENDDIPNVTADQGSILVLDITSWPASWQTGKVIVVRMPSGVVTYKRLLVRFKQPNGELVIGVADASPLEALHTCELISGGNIAEIAQQSKAFRKTPRKIVTPIDFDNTTTVSLIDEEDIVLYKDSGHDATVEAKITEIGLKVVPHVRAKLVVDKPWSPLDGLESLAEKASSSISDFLNVSGTTLQDDPDGVVVIADLQQAQSIIDGILALKDVSDALDGITSALCDKRRLKEATAIVDGEILGVVRLSASASADCIRQFELGLATIQIPITGPVPIFLEFELLGVGSLTFVGRVQIASGAEVSIPFYAGLKVIDGEIQDLPKPDDVPQFTFIPPTFDGTRARLELAAGVKCEAGISLATIISASADPKAELVFETKGDVTGNVSAGCLDLAWELFGRLTAQLSAELDIKVREFGYHWDIPIEFKLPLAGDQWQTCWGEQDQVEAPTFDPPDGTAFTDSVDVKISCATAGAVIRYTTDGSTPTSSSGTLYSNTPVRVTDTTTVKSIAYSSGMLDSNVASATYSREPIETPQLAVTPRSLEFGCDKSQLTFKISNAGSGTLNWSVRADPRDSWMGVGDGTQNAGGDGEFSGIGDATITVTVGRVGMREDAYTSEIVVSEGSQEITVTVDMEVCGGAPEKPSYTYTPGTGVGAYEYGDETGQQLVDGEIGVADYSVDLGNGPAYEWLGWKASRVQITFDFGQTVAVSELHVRYNNYRVGGVDAPELSEVFVSELPDSGLTSVGSCPFEQDNDPSVKELRISTPGASGRYYHLVATGIREWLLIDEITFHKAAD